MLLLNRFVFLTDMQQNAGRDPKDPPRVCPGGDSTTGLFQIPRDSDGAMRLAVLLGHEGRRQAGQHTSCGLHPPPSVENESRVAACKRQTHRAIQIATRGFVFAAVRRFRNVCRRAQERGQAFPQSAGLR